MQKELHGAPFEEDAGEIVLQTYIATVLRNWIQLFCKTMNMKEHFLNLIVWQKAHKLVLWVYAHTKNFPPDEKYGLTDDMRRATRSVPTNIVEGYRRKGYKDALCFFNRSDASLAEVKYHTLLAHELGYLESAHYNELVELEEEVGRFLGSWQKNYTQNNL